MKTRTLSCSCSVAVLILLVFPSFVHAATLFVTATPATVAVGSTVALTVLVNSAGTAINSADGTLTFPRALFDLVSIEKQTSLFSLWIQSPSYDGDHTIAFNGGLPSPGYAGSSGILFTVILRAKAAGSATIDLVNSTVRANDGKGTDVLSAASGATVTVKAIPAPAPTPPAPPAPASVTAGQASSITKAPAPTLAITSDTNPSQDAWYASSTAHFAWTVNDNVDAVETAFGPSESTTTWAIDRPAVLEKTETGISDGVWYFLVRAHTKAGWGAISSYKIQSDLTPPALHNVVLAYNQQSHSVTVSPAESVDPGEPLAFDALSGVAQLVVLVDGAPVGVMTQNLLATTTIALPDELSEGPHTLALRSVDRAGNFAETAPTRFAVTHAVFVDWFTLPRMVVLLGIMLLLLLCSLAGNVFLWRKNHRLRHRLRTVAAGSIKGSALEQRARARLLELKAHLRTHAGELFGEPEALGTGESDFRTVNAVQTWFREIEEYIDSKIDSLRGK